MSDSKSRGERSRLTVHFFFFWKPSHFTFHWMCIPAYFLEVRLDTVARNVVRNVARKVARNVVRNLGRNVFEDEKSQCVLCKYILCIFFWDYFFVLQGTKL